MGERVDSCIKRVTVVEWMDHAGIEERHCVMKCAYDPREKSESESGRKGGRRDACSQYPY